VGKGRISTAEEEERRKSRKLTTEGAEVRRGKRGN